MGAPPLSTESRGKARLSKTAAGPGLRYYVLITIILKNISCITKIVLDTEIKIFVLFHIVLLVIGTVHA